MWWCAFYIRGERGFGEISACRIRSCKKLKLSSIIAVANGTFEAKPVISHAGFGIAVVTIDQGLRVPKFFGHGLCFDSAFEAGELPFHVDYRTITDRAAVGGLHMFMVAAMMNAMTTTHENYSLRRGEHIFATDRTVTIGGSFNAAVSVAYRDGHANAAGLYARVSVLPLSL